MLYQLSCNYSLFVNLPQKGIFNRSVLAIGHNLMLFCPKGLYLVEEMKKVLYVTLSGQGAYLQEILVCVKGAYLCWYISI